MGRIGSISTLEAYDVDHEVLTGSGSQLVQRLHVQQRGPGCRDLPTEKVGEIERITKFPPCDRADPNVSSSTTFPFTQVLAVPFSLSIKSNSTPEAILRVMPILIRDEADGLSLCFLVKSRSRGDQRQGRKRISLNTRRLKDELTTVFAR